MKICNICNKKTFIWKNYKGLKYCKYCWLKENPIKKIKQKSIKQKLLDKEYFILRNDFLFKHPKCQACFDNDCTLISTEIHHKAGRIGKNYLDNTKFLSVCRNCHTKIHDNPKESMIRKFMLSRLKL